MRESTRASFNERESWATVWTLPDCKSSNTCSSCGLSCAHWSKSSFTARVDSLSKRRPEGTAAL